MNRGDFVRAIVVAFSLPSLSQVEAKNKGRKNKKNKCDVSHDSTCKGKSDNDLCFAQGKCRNGKCVQPHLCWNFSDGPDACWQHDDCCTGFCTYTGDIPRTPGQCVKGEVGQGCREDIDCVSGACVGYLCQ